MPHYIRFLQCPRVHRDRRGSTSVSALLTIETDLGDFLLPETVDLRAALLVSTSSGLNAAQQMELPQKHIYKKKLVWKAGDRASKFTFGPFDSDISSLPLQVFAGHGNDSREADPLVTAGDAPSISSACSAVFGGGHGLQAEPVIERRFAIAIGAPLKIWEETGNSIARHIWDAALACVIELQNIARGDGELLESLDFLLGRGSRKVRVLELGTGCGIVGIAVAQIFPRCEVNITDLEEVRDISTKNVQQAQLATGSTCEFSVLDWDDEDDDRLTLRGDGLGLIVVSDCIYNPDSVTGLVGVLERYADPKTAILVATKRRHESENGFFDKMRESHFRIESRSQMALPTMGADDETVNIELYVFRHFQSA